MLRLDVRPDYRLLVRLLRDPSQFDHLSAEDLSRAIDVADHARLLGWLLTQAETRQIPRNPPDWLADRMVTVAALVADYERAIRWEIDRLRRAFFDADLPWILMKGAAYVAAKLPPGRGRRVADIDVLVPFDRLSDAESALLAHGWEFTELDTYDSRYYREWMHELPPLVHPIRGSNVDVHHAILPRTSRLKPPTARLIEHSREIDAGIRVLSPAHIVLHAAAHLFHDGEIAGAIRDIVDLDALLRHYGSDAAFWPELTREARELGLVRPAYYALRYANRLLNTPIPPAVMVDISAGRPPAGVERLMDRFVERTVPVGADEASSTAVFALYVRSHWLRMPPLMLARHLLRKASMRP